MVNAELLTKQFKASLNFLMLFSGYPLLLLLCQFCYDALKT